MPGGWPRAIPPLPAGIPILPGKLKLRGKRRVPVGMILFLVLAGVVALIWFYVWYGDYDSKRIDALVTCRSGRTSISQVPRVDGLRRGRGHLGRVRAAPPADPNDAASSRANHGGSRSAAAPAIRRLCGSGGGSTTICARRSASSSPFMCLSRALRSLHWFSGCQCCSGRFISPSSRWSSTRSVRLCSRQKSRRTTSCAGRQGRLTNRWRPRRSSPGVYSRVCSPSRRSPGCCSSGYGEECLWTRSALLTFFALILTIVGLILVNRSFSASVWTALRRPNPTLLWILAAVVAILTLTLAWPFAAHLFRFGPLHVDDLALTVGAGVIVFACLDAIKLMRGAWRKSDAPRPSPSRDMT